jgi:hypothetical protein
MFLIKNITTMYTTELAIRSAINVAREKNVKGKLLKEIDEDSDFSDGDPETIYTIASYTSQFVEDNDVDTARDMIEDALGEIYPDLV